jgi:hypothetical protein
MPQRRLNTGSYPVTHQDEPSAFRGREAYHKAHPVRAAGLRRFIAHVREGFALSRRAFDDVDATPKKPDAKSC